MSGSGRYIVRQGLLALLVVEMIAAWSVLRTDLYLRQPVERALDRVGAALGGHFSFSSIGPAGLTGLEIRDLSFDRIRGEPFHAELGLTRVFPELAALTRGELRLGDVECLGLSSRLDMDWLSSVESAVSDSGSGAQGTPGTSPRFSRLDWRWIWAFLPEQIRLESARLELDGAGSWTSGRELVLEDLRVDLSGEDGQPEIRVDGEFTLEGFPGGRVTGRWVVGSGLQVSIALWEPLDLFQHIPAGWRSRLPVMEGIPEGAALFVGGLELCTPLRSVTLTDVEVVNLNASIPGVDRWRFDGFEAERLRVERRESGPAIHIESGQILVSGILEWVNLSLKEGDIWLDWSFEQPRASFVLQGPQGGLLSVELARSSFSGDVVVSLWCDAYPAQEWGRFLPEDYPFQVVTGDLTGHLDLSIPADGSAMLVSIDGRLADGEALAPFLSNNRLRAIDLGLSGDFTLNRGGSELVWEQGRLQIGGQSILFDGTLGWSRGDLALVLNATATDVEAEELFQGIPRGVAPSLEDYHWDGEMSAFLYVDLEVTRPDQAVVDLQLDLSRVRVREYGSRAPVDRLGGDFSIEIPTSDSLGRIIGPLEESWISLDQVAPHLVGALVSAEDVNFWTHEGFDWPGILRSLQVNLSERRFVRGGSTISQQVARSLFLGHERTLGRKFEEAVLTWQMEGLLSKSRIMELYLNAVHWGPGIYGVNEAASTYFRRRPDQLSLRESAFLAAILPNPDLFGLQYAQEIVVSSRRQKICRILRNMRSNGEISYAAYRENCSRATEGEISVSPVPEYLVVVGHPENPADRSPDTLQDFLVQASRDTTGASRRVEP